MKRISLLGIVFFLFSCSGENRKPVFSGEIVTLTDLPEIVPLTGENILFHDDIHAGYMSVYDSLLLFITPQYPEHFLYVFDINSRDLVGQFCPKGRGPDDFLDFYHSEQYLVKNGEIKLWGYDSRREAYLLNLTRSIERKQTVVDSMITINWIDDHTRPWALSFFLDSTSFLLKNQPEKVEDKPKAFDLAAYHLYKGDLNHLSNEFKLFNRLPKASDNGQTVEMFYYSLDRINSQKNRLAMGMLYLSQINILDISSGELTGFQLKDTPNFDTLNANEPKYYYGDICVDDQMILGLYFDSPAILQSDIIHLYDWSGRFIKRIKLDHEVDQIAFDPVGKYLYGTTSLAKLFRYDLKGI